MGPYCCNLGCGRGRGGCAFGIPLDGNRRYWPTSGKSRWGHHGGIVATLAPKSHSLGGGGVNPRFAPARVGSSRNTWFESSKCQGGESTMRKEARQRVDIFDGESDHPRTQAGPRGVGRRPGTDARSTRSSSRRRSGRSQWARGRWVLPGGQRGRVLRACACLNASRAASWSRSPGAQTFLRAIEMPVRVCFMLPSG